MGPLAPPKRTRKTRSDGSRCNFWRCTVGNTGESSSDERTEFIGRRRRVRSPKKKASPVVVKLDDQLRFHQLIDAFGTSVLANDKVYKSLRWEVVENDERGIWTPTMARLAVEGSSWDVREELQTAIRRGVPDGLKQYLIRKAHDATDFLASREGFVTKTYIQVFGKKTPTFSGGRVPTFSGGFEGAEFFKTQEKEEIEDDWDVKVVSSPFGASHRVPLTVSPTRMQHKLKATRSISWDNLDKILTTASRHNVLSRQGSTWRAPNSSSGLMSHRPLEHLQSRQMSFQEYAIQLNRAPSIRVRPNQSLAQLTITGTGFRKPSVSGEYTLQGVTSLYRLLSVQGQTTAKKILWTVNSLYPQIEFAPVLAPLICILSCYVTEDIVLVTILRILDKSNELLKTNASRPFLTFRRSEYVRFVKMAMAFAEKHFPQLTAHLANINVDLPAWLARSLEDGFSERLPFDLVLRIYMSFLFEGLKVFLRYALAFLKLEEEQLLFCSTAEEANLTLLLREYRQADPETMNDVTKLAYQFEIRANNAPMSKFTSHDVPTPYLRTSHIKQRLYRPRLHDMSSVIHDDHWEFIWSHLPSCARILDPFLKFTTTKDGHSIKAIQRALWDEEDKPMVFCLSTRDGDILGGISPISFKTNSRLLANLLDLSTASVFQLAPHQMCFPYSGKSGSLFETTTEALRYGFNGPAICLDSDLLHGQSTASDTFNSPCLVSNDFGDFELLVLEVWLLS